MKKSIFVLGVILLSCFNAVADTVTRQRAEEYAKRYFGSESVNYAPRSDKKYSGVTSAPATLHVFNNPDGGWVIISGEDCTAPVLAHSSTGSFRWDGMPSNIRAWFDILDNGISKIRKENLKPSKRVAAKWAAASPGAKTATEMKVLTTAEWDQYTPYNNACKSATGGKNVYTGCVATAMAIVMRYHQWPEYGKGVIPAYTTESSSYKISSVNIENYKYEWSSMPTNDGYSNTWTSAQKKAVSELIFHCGAMVQMDYTTDGSGAYTFDIIPAAVKYMSYSKAASYETAAIYKLGEWMDKVRAEIDADRPLLYSASGSEGGHQFVCDGYDMSNNELHFNWGWGGWDNGFYTVDLEEIDLAEYQDAIFNFAPDKTGTSVETPVITLEPYETTSGTFNGEGLKLNSGNVAKGSNFTVKATYLFNNGNTYKGAVKAALVTKDGTFKEFVSGEYAITLDNFYTGDKWYATVSSLSCKITSDTGIGDRIVLYYKNPNAEEWLPVKSELSILSFNPYLPVYDINFINCNDVYSAGEWLYFELCRGKASISSLEWFFDGVQNEKGYVQLKSGTHTIKAVIGYSNGGSETITATIKVN